MRNILIIGFLSACLATCGVCRADYLAAGWTRSRVFYINESTGVATYLDQIPGWFANDMVRDAGGRYWVAASTTSIFQNARLYEFDPVVLRYTGGFVETTLNGIYAMALAPTGVMIAAGASNDVYTLDMNTGNASPIGHINLHEYGIQGMAFRSDGQLVGWGISPNFFDNFGLYHIDLTTLDAVRLSPTFTGMPAWRGLTQAPSGHLFAVGNQLDSLSADFHGLVDGYTGATLAVTPIQSATPLAPPFLDLRGVAWIPSPGPAAVFALFMTGVAIRRRRDHALRC